MSHISTDVHTSKDSGVTMEAIDQDIISIVNFWQIGHLPVCGIYNDISCDDLLMWSGSNSLTSLPAHTTGE